MKTIAIPISVFEKGDRVTTLEGDGIVIEDESIDTSVLPYRFTSVKLDEPTHNYPNGIAAMDSWLLTLE